MAVNINEFPKELTVKREAIECNFIFSLYKDPALLEDYKNVENTTDIITEDGIFYYGLAQNMHKAGYQAFDNISIYTFLEDKKTLKEGFEQRGGYKSIQEITSLLNTDNVDTYYDDLVKNNMLMRLYKAGFNVVDKLDKFNQMSSSELYDYYDYQLNNIAVGKVEKIKVENISDGYDEYIEEADKGLGVGFKIGFPMMNRRLLGVHKKNLLLHAGGIGQGKTSTAILMYVLPAIESGANITILANEQGITEFRSMILSSVLFNKIGFPKGMDRQKFVIGHFTDEQKAKMHEAANWLRNQPGKIFYVELQDYSVGTVKKIIKKQSRLGCELFLVDTLKPEDDASERAWAEFSNVAKELFLLSKNLDVAIIATAQLAGEAMFRTYLDLSCMGKSKAISETATQVVMFRPMTDKEKESLKVYKFNKDDNGNRKIKTVVELDPNKNYAIYFTPKNRFGGTETQLVYERNMSFNTMYEIGYTNIEYEAFSRR